jgi:hypothetical protein
VLKKQRRKTHGLLAEFGTHGGLGGRAVVAFVEEQVKRALDGWKAPGKVVGARYIEQPLRSRQHFLGREMRFSIAASLLTNAFAISFTLNPHKMCSTSATCASSEAGDGSRRTSSEADRL